MKAELERIIEAIELAKLRVVNFKNRVARDPVRLDDAEDAEMALGWALKRVKKLVESVENEM